MEELIELRKKLMERWDLTRTFGGDWNDGYSEALRYAMSLIYDELRVIERQQQKELNAKHIHHNPPKKDGPYTSKGYEK